ncbi:MAG TPA: hypothetical protein VN616_02600 [Puia sp.]|nr:hypothetical protein [Puia sp.]
MKYVVLSTEWSRPVYFCNHNGSGFTVSTDPKKAQVFSGLELAEAACTAFAEASGMKCEVRKI